jgi:hypothetical protein
MKATYKNSWYKKYPADDFRKSIGPEFYESDSVPVEYAGLFIYQRQEFGYPIFDVVQNGICVSQRAGLNGAKQAAEAIVNAAGQTLAAEGRKP